jgi:phosphoglycerol transferase
VNLLIAIFVSLTLTGCAFAVRRRKQWVDQLLAPLLVFLLGVETVAFFVADWFTGNGIDDSVIYHVRSGLRGAGMDDYWWLVAGAIAGLLVSAFLAVLAAWRLKKLSHGGNTVSSLVFIATLISAVLIHPASLSYFGMHGSPLHSVLHDERQDFADFYRIPLIKETPDFRKNLVVIFLESFERSFFDETIFPNLVKELRHLESEAITFTQIDQLLGTAWTIGGMTASLCGLPLFTTSHGNSMAGMKPFLPGATCFGDLLAPLDMSLTYLSGSSVEFAGTGNLFRDHGFERVVGVEQLRDENGFEDPQGWGITDDLLFEHAFKEFRRASETRENFGLFISTIDTHPPAGRLSPPCEALELPAQGNAMLDAIACSDRIVSGFVRRILDSGYSDSTVVALVSDHLALPNEASGMLSGMDRKNLFMILNGGTEAAVITKPGSPLDIAPTLLATLGYSSDLALGRNLLGDEPSLRELVPNLKSEIANWFDSIIRFWSFPRLSEGDLVSIDGQSGKVQFAGSEFDFPILVEIEPDGETLVRFDSNYEGYRLHDFLARINPRVPFFWVDSCPSVNHLLNAPNADFCLVYGSTAASTVRVQSIESKLTLASDDILDSLSKVLPTRSMRTIGKQAIDPERIIAHAGGNIDGHAYTNTLEALNSSYDRGFRLFELDIIQTSDGEFVAAHDWNYWQQLTGYSADIPPTRMQFLATPVLNHLTPLDMGRINDWFQQHPDAILVTDKINDPVAFASRFTDRNRLMMELFSLDALNAGIEAGIRSAMPSDNLVMSFGDDAVEKLITLGVKDIAISRRRINTQGKLLSELRQAGIRAYAFHINRVSWRDESFALCSDLDFVFGFYADTYDFSSPPNCND